MAEEFAGRMEEDRKFTVTVSRPSGCKRILSIEIPNEEVEKEEVHVSEELRRDLKVPGFRNGKVPLKYIEKNYAAAIHDDAIRNLLPAVYEDALVKVGITPIGKPKFENLKAKKGEGVTVEVGVEIRPEINLRDYVGVEVGVEKKTIGDKEVEETIERIREQRAVFVVVERPAKEGDLLVIDYAPVLPTGELDTKRTVRNYPVDLTSESLLSEFREGLRGMEVKGEKDIEVHYPDDFPEKPLAGARRTYRVTVKEIKEMRLPELNDPFAREVGEQFADLPALKLQIKAGLENEEEKRRRHEAEEKIIDRVIESNPFDVPEAMIENYLSTIIEQDRRRRPNVADEAEREREIREHFRGAASRTIKKFIVLEAVRNQEHIAVDTEELDASIEELSKNGGEKADEVRAYFRHPERRRSVENELLDKKAIDFLREKAVVTVG